MLPNGKTNDYYIPKQTGVLEETMLGIIPATTPAVSIRVWERVGDRGKGMEKGYHMVYMNTKQISLDPHQAAIDRLQGLVVGTECLLVLPIHLVNKISPLLPPPWRKNMMF